jgi:hypothetical protein
MLGKQVKDKVTGQVGAVTAQCESLNGHKQSRIEGHDPSGTSFDKWVDTDRLEAV